MSQPILRSGKNFLVFIVTWTCIQAAFTSAQGPFAWAQLQNKTPSPTPEAVSAKRQLEHMRSTLPERALTVDLVVALGMKSSNRFKQVKSQAHQVLVPLLQAESAYNTHLQVGQNWYRSDNESNNPQSPNETDTTSTTVGLSKNFFTGTAVQIEASQGYSQIGFPAGSFINIDPYYETKGSLSLSQNLWADGFGYASRRALRAARLTSEMRGQELKASVETWALGIVNTFYSAWYTQAQAMAARQGFQRRERLLAVSNLRLRRGTAEVPDHLQVESAYLMSKSQMLEAMKRLDDEWRRLIINLRLPAEWMEIASVDVPLKIDNVVDKGLKLCEGFRQKGVPDVEPAALKSVRLMSESAELNWEKAQNEKWPDLKLHGQYFFNGISDSRDESRTEAFDRDHPGWLVGITLQLPIEFSDRKAKLGEAKAQQMRAEALRDDAKDDFHLSWLNECANIERLNQSLRDAEVAYKNQSRRADLEEQRFRLGRSSTLSVIQAGDDATQAEIFLRGTEIQIRQSAWRLLELNTQIVDELKGIAQKNGGSFDLSTL
jgi:outer membrane protein TolC